MANARRGEVWLVDLGLAAKVRPSLVINVPFLDQERALYAIIPHTTVLRESRFEAIIDVRWLDKGAFDAQGVRNIPGSVFIRKLGTLNEEQIKTVESTLRIWLGL